MTIAARKNLTMDQGATFQQVVRYKDSAGTPIDLAGWTGTFTIMNRGSGTVVDEVACDLSPVGTAVGYITIKLTDEETAAIDDKTYAYTLELEDPTGNLFRLLFGQLIVRAGHNV